MVSKALGIDYGIKRIGLAISDEIGIIATALETVATNEIWAYLEVLIPKENIAAIVVGEPMGLGGMATDSTAAANNFSARLAKRYPHIQVARMNEMFTSKLARRSMIESGMSKKKRQTKGAVDQISAAIILQDWLNQQ
jgi:putative holliday junction resolvase